MSFWIERTTGGCCGRSGCCFLVGANLQIDSSWCLSVDESFSWAVFGELVYFELFWAIRKLVVSV